MKWIVSFLLLSVITQSAFSADSTWLLCDNGAAIFNTVEHRSADGSGRETSVQMLIGVNILQGQLVYSSSGEIDSGTVTLLGPEKSQLSFTGAMTLDYSKKVVFVRGKLSESDVLIPFKEKMKCKQMHANGY